MKLAIEPLESSPDIFHLPIAFIMLAVAQAGSAKIEAQHGKSETVQRLHGVKDDLVVQRTTKEWVGMAHYSGVGSVVGTGIQQCLQASGRPLQKKRTNG